MEFVISASGSWITAMDHGHGVHLVCLRPLRAPSPSPTHRGAASTRSDNGVLSPTDSGAGVLSCHLLMEVRVARNESAKMTATGRMASASEPAIASHGWLQQPAAGQRRLQQDIIGQSVLQQPSTFLAASTVSSRLGLPPGTPRRRGLPRGTMDLGTVTPRRCGLPPSRPPPSSRWWVSSTRDGAAPEGTAAQRMGGVDCVVASKPGGFKLAFVRIAINEECSNDGNRKDGYYVKDGQADWDCKHRFRCMVETVIMLSCIGFYAN